MKNYTNLKIACYSSNISMSVVCNLSPLLFLTFRSMYGISYTLLGLLVLMNFSTQLLIDLIFSFYSHKFNIPFVVKTMPFICCAGLILYACSPWIFINNPYIGLAIGTVIISVSAGLGEVLISPIIAEIPAENPEREMSKLHSIYAWGVVGAVLFSTFFLHLFGYENWQILTLILTLIPFCSGILFLICEIPSMKSHENTSDAKGLLKNKGVWLCVVAIFLGGASECTMAQWVSGYLERAVDIPKIWGDVFGVALFAATLGLGRSLYGKIGKNISKVLWLGSIGATICYFVAAVTSLPIIGLFACAFTGFCVSMLWPGSLVVASDRFPKGGVVIFALMAAGGDLGASVGPQLVGVVTDSVINNPDFFAFAEKLNVTTEQLGMKFGLLVGMIFPLAAIVIYSIIRKTDST